MFMSIPFKEIRETAVVSKVLESIGVEVKRRKIQCPSGSHDDAHPSCKVYDHNVYCYACGYYADAVKVYQDIKGVTTREAAEAIAQMYGIEMKRSKAKKKPKAADQMPTISDAKQWQSAAFKHVLSERERWRELLSQYGQDADESTVSAAVDSLTRADHLLEALTSPTEKELMELYTDREQYGLKEIEPEAANEAAADPSGLDSIEWDGDTLNAENFRKYLACKGIGLKLNTISNRIEYSGIQNIESGHLDNVFPLLAYDDLHRHLSRVSEKLCAHYAAYIATVNEYNPFMELVRGTRWDGNDRLTEIYNALHIDEADDLSRTFIKKWFMQGLALQYNTLEKPISPEFVLVLHGEQGIGKTTFFRKMAISSKFFKEGHELNPNDKDSKAEACAYLITELGEVARTIKRDPDSLKAFLTSATDEWRKPYATAAERHPRRTNFCATTNDEKFLADQTGNRRWGIIHVETIDVDFFLHRFSESDALQLWAQIAKLVDDACKNGETIASCFRLTPSEREAQERINKRMLKEVDAQLEIEDIFVKAALHPSDYAYTDVTISEFKAWYSSLDRYTVEKLSRALKAAGATPPDKRKRVNGTLVRLWKLPVPTRKVSGIQLSINEPDTQKVQ